MTLYVAKKHLEKSHWPSHTVVYHTRDCGHFPDDCETRSDQWHYRIEADAEECRHCTDGIEKGEIRSIKEGSHLESVLKEAAGGD